MNRSSGATASHGDVTVPASRRCPHACRGMCLLRARRSVCPGKRLDPLQETSAGTVTCSKASCRKVARARRDGTGCSDGRERAALRWALGARAAGGPETPRTEAPGSPPWRAGGARGLQGEVWARDAVLRVSGVYVPGGQGRGRGHSGREKGPSEQECRRRSQEGPGNGRGAHARMT